MLAGNGQISITRSRITKRSSTFVNPYLQAFVRNVRPRSPTRPRRHPASAGTTKQQPQIPKPKPPPQQRPRQLHPNTPRPGRQHSGISQNPHATTPHSRVRREGANHKTGLEPKWPTNASIDDKAHPSSSSSSSLLLPPATSTPPSPSLPADPSAVPLSLSMPLRSQVPSEALRVQRTG